MERAEFERRRRELEERALAGPGALSPDVRQRAAAPRATAAQGGADPVEALVDTIHRHAYRVTDDHYAALRTGGLSDDQLFELTVAAALGAARERVEAGLAALDAAVSARGAK